MRADELAPCFKILARVKQIQQPAVRAVGGAGDADAVASTRHSATCSAARRASSRRSIRAIEFLLGNKNADMLEVFRHDPAARRCSTEALCRRRRSTTSSCATSRGAVLPVPRECVERDWTQPHVRHPEPLVPVLQARSTTDPKRWWDAYDMCEKLVDIEESFQLWRFRHMKTVERIIGHKPAPAAAPVVRS